jgi:hypothetical protein
LRIARHAGNGDHASAAERTDQAVLHAFEEVLADLRERGVRAKKKDE